MLVLEEETIYQMVKDAELQYPKECCGILVGRRLGSERRFVEEVYPMKNAAGEQQERRFFIDPLALSKAEQYAAKNEREVIGFYHSHPDCPAEASAEDERYALPECSYPILSVVRGKVCDMKSYILYHDRFASELIQCRMEANICQ